MHINMARAFKNRLSNKFYDRPFQLKLVDFETPFSGHLLRGPLKSITFISQQRTSLSDN